MTEENRSGISEAQKEIIRLMTEGALTPSKIANLRGTSLQAVYKTLRKLEAKGIISHVSTGVWNVCQDTIKPPLTTGTMRGFKVPVEEQIIDLHALEIDMPIIRGNLDLIKDFEGYPTKGMRGWTPEYSKFPGPIGFTVRNNNNKSVSIFIYSRTIPRSYDIHKLCRNTIFYAYKLMEEKGVILDLVGASTKNLNISVSNRDLDRVFSKGEIFKVKLGRLTEKIFTKDKDKEAESWVDSSPRLGIETNDLKYKENLLMVPERVERMDLNLNALSAEILKTLKEELTPTIRDLSYNMVTHVDIMKGIDKGIEAFNKTVAGFKPEQTALSAWKPKRKKRIKRVPSVDERMIGEVVRQNVTLTEFKG